MHARADCQQVAQGPCLYVAHLLLLFVSEVRVRNVRRDGGLAALQSLRDVGKRCDTAAAAHA